MALVSIVVDENIARPGETAGGQRLGTLGYGLLFQRLHQNALYPAHVDQIDLQGLRQAASRRSEV